MPEGDSLHNIAELLRPALIDQTLRQVSVPRQRGMYRLRAGDVVTSVESRGKFLEITVERGLVLRTHLRMTGSWHLYESGQRWTKPQHLARAVLHTDLRSAVCFAAPVVEVGVVGDDRLDHLGPDLCDADVDIDEILLRLVDANPASSIGDVLLDQRLAAGIGNVYRNETLFACGVNPATPLRDLDEAARRQLYTTAAAQLQANLGRWRRETTDGGLAVYDRARQGCVNCMDRIRVSEQGTHGRITYWCPSCQPVDSG